jgi:hypothetical protein
MLIFPRPRWPCISSHREATSRDPFRGASRANAAATRWATMRKTQKLAEQALALLKNERLITTVVGKGYECPES